MNPTSVPAAKSVDWQQVKEWDERYVFHVLATKDEYHSLPVESAEGCYVTLADGRKIFDFANQLVCVNMGHRHPRIQAAIREATEKFGYIWEGMTTEYRSRAAKLIMEDLEVGKWAGRIRFLSTGTESVENMVLFAKLYTGRRNIVTRTHDYHGWTTPCRARTASGAIAPVWRRARARRSSATCRMPRRRTITMRLPHSAIAVRSGTRTRTARTARARWHAFAPPSTSFACSVPRPWQGF